ncbi:hypothetical protein LY76DRAFT_590400 [Colletotrichum caudatum]|nr:hypothetical protein LY76DRAFT_590400 [Colletotrichum caudatum]
MTRYSFVCIVGLTLRRPGLLLAVHRTKPTVQVTHILQRPLARHPHTHRNGLGTDESFHRLPPFSLSITNGPGAFGSLSNGVSANTGRPCRIGAGVCRRRLRVMVMREPRLHSTLAQLYEFANRASVHGPQ